MKKTLTATAIASALGLSVIAVPSIAQAGASANIGLTSNYYFRGIEQTESASASAGLDYEHDSGLYVGTWAADVETGLEYDLYGGYVYSADNFHVGAGVTGYYYTDDAFDDSYEEVNLYAGFGPVSLEHSIGTWDGYGDEADYTFTAVNVEYAGFYGTFGSHGDDFEGSYFEVGYGTEIGGFDVGAGAIFADEDLGGGDEDEALVFNIGKSFDL